MSLQANVVEHYSVTLGSPRVAFAYWRRLAARMARDGHPNTGQAYAITASLASKCLDAGLEILDVNPTDDFRGVRRLQSSDRQTIGSTPDASGR